MASPRGPVRTEELSSFMLRNKASRPIVHRPLRASNNAAAVQSRCSMMSLGPNLGEPHTTAFGDGLFELRLKGAEGIARVFFCTLVGKRIVMLHSFIKKSERTPIREREVAETRLKEIKHANA